MRGVARKNELEDLEISVAKEVKRRKKKRQRLRGHTRIAKEVREKKRMPPPVPKNKSLKEIQAMDSASIELRHPQGRPRKWFDFDGTPLVDPKDLTWKERILFARQVEYNHNRGKTRKWEAEVVVASRELDTHRIGNSDMDEDEALAQGLLSFDSWDDEELIRGYRRNRKGNFGPPPATVSREVQQEAFRRLIGRGERKLRSAYIKSVEGLVNLAQNAQSEKVRLDATKTLLERVVGKVPDRIITSQEEPWSDMLADSLVPVVDIPPLELELSSDGVARLAEVDAPPDDPVAAPGPRAQGSAAPSAKTSKKTRSRGSKKSNA